jgi:hypothetical protein
LLQRTSLSGVEIDALFGGDPKPPLKLSDDSWPPSWMPPVTCARKIAQLS